LSFNPDLCRNESEVESKLIVQYLLPQLGYSPDTWHQEITFGSIRLDFLAFATQVIPFVLDANSLLSVVLEAKHPRENLDNHARKLKRYLTSLNVRYGLLTNGREIRIYERIDNDIKLEFFCLGREVHDKIGQIKALIGKDNLNEGVGIRDRLKNFQNFQSVANINPETIRNKTVKIITVYHNKGGVGKTTTVVNLAAAIRKKGKRVLVVDLDSQANTTFATGLVKFDDEEFDDIKDSNVRHVLESEDFYSIQEVARRSQFTNPEISVVPSHISLMKYENDLNQIDASKTMLGSKLKDVKNEYDIVLIDTPPSLNLYARISLITADYLIIPSDLKPFANQGLINVKDFIKKVDAFRKVLRKPPLAILGVLACKISTNAKFVQHTLPKRLKTIPDRYSLEVMDTVIYDRDDLAKCAEKTQVVGDLEIADPVSVLDYKPDSIAAQEFELLAMEVLGKIGMA
jgi:cellulose biosynthesis protein BcsQ